MDTKTPKPAVGAPHAGENTGSAALAPPHDDATAKGRAGRRLADSPPPLSASAPDTFYCAINQDGYLRLEYGGAAITLPAAHVLTLGDFLHATRRLWRP